MEDKIDDNPISPMWLQRVDIMGFRSCLETSVTLRPNLTLLVGENNAGKSNIIDAIRLATEPLSGRRTRYFEPDDLSQGYTDPSTVKLTLSGATDFQQALFLSSLDLETGEIIQQTRFHAPGSDKYPRGKTERLANKAGIPDPEPETRKKINHVYLAPLRDAQRELDSSSGRRIGQLLTHLLEKDDRQAFLNEATDTLGMLGRMSQVTGLKTRIQDHLSALTDAVRGHTVDLSFEEPTLYNLGRGLRLKMAEHGVSTTDLASSGLGYANLLFISTVLLELQLAKDSELTILLVDEPEAHLHPQLQNVLIEFLLEQSENSASASGSDSAGRLQVIATSHSPNMASVAGIERTVVTKSVDESFSKTTKALALNSIQFSNNSKEQKDIVRKIDQYLDVSRSELLFSQRVILVEGISEAVLLPVLAKYCVFPKQPINRDTLWRRLRATSIINIGSVDFNPYLRLLLTEVDGFRLVDRVTAITDRDPQTSKEPNNREKLYNRKAELLKLAEDLGAQNMLIVAEAPHTLEADLVVEGSSNHEVLKEAFLLQHRDSREKWDKLLGTPPSASNMYKALQSKIYAEGLNISKGQFAHDVAVGIQEGALSRKTFVCPPYLEEAILGIVDLGERDA